MKNANPLSANDTMLLDNNNKILNQPMQGKNTTTTFHESTAFAGLRQLFEGQLKDIYWAEQALVKAIPSMIKLAGSTELKDTLKTHLIETREQINRCIEVFESIDILPENDVCEAMKGLIEEAKELMDEFEEGHARDAAIICAAQKIEHYEIATYGTLVSLAGILGETEAESILEEILDEEKNTNNILSEISMNTFTIAASKEAH